MEKLLIIDGNSLMNRAFYAIPLLKTADGIYTNGVYGFTNMLLRLLDEEKPDYIAVAFDKGKPTFRHLKYDAYKGQRKKSPDELNSQFPLLKEILKAMRVPILEMEGFEADDIIGTLARKAKEKGISALIVTGDRDAFQLIDQHTTVAFTRKGISEVEVYDLEKIQTEYGLQPKQLIEVKALMGDASDNIPGVPKVGEKTALKLIQEFGELKQVLAHAAEIGGKLGENLQNYQELARLSRELAAIDCDVPVETEIKDLKTLPPNEKELTKLFQEFQFRKLLEKFSQEELKTEIKAEPDYTTNIIHGASAEEIVLNLAQKETLTVFPLSSPDGIFALGLGDGEKTYYFEMHSGKGSLQDFAPLFEGESAKYCYSSKELYHLCYEVGIKPKNITFDLEIAAYLLNPSDSGYSFTKLALDYLNKHILDPSEVFGSGKKAKKIKTIDRPTLEQFVAQRVNVIYECRQVMMEKIEEMDLLELYRDVELPLARVLALMEITGVAIDVQGLERMGKELEAKIEGTQRAIIELAGHSLNINSPQQLGKVLFEELKLPVIKKTKTGYSTDVEVLEQLMGLHPIIEHILNYRQLVKLKGTYIDGLIKLVNPNTGKIHTTFNQTVTATGRLSSTEPNLQNIPIRLEEGRKIREVFIPDEKDEVILAADYSQIELRILAHFSRDPGMVDAFMSNQDIHTRTAAEIFNVPMEQVSRLMRSQAKAVNFGIIYGISDFGLAKNVGISRKKAKDFIANYFAKYPGIKTYIDKTVAQAREKGYAVTLLKRRRYLPDLHSRNYNIRQFAERTAINTPIQGSAADIIKVAMVNIQRELEDRGLKSRMLLQVHDELIFEVPREEIPTMIQIVRDKMEHAVKLTVPLTVDIKIGENWYSVEKI
jgi:DNA polymerase-1